jgi:hypothetical protein
MSLGIAFKSPEGVILAADSRVTLTATLPQAQPVLPGTPSPPTVLLPCTYDNATKLLHVKSQPHIGAVTYGAAAIGIREPRTAHSYLPELEEIVNKEFPGKRMTVAEYAKVLSDFFMGKWTSQNMPTGPGQDMIFLVGGYDFGGVYGKLFEIFIPNNPTPVERCGSAGDFGMVWGGQREFADRLVGGFDGRLPGMAQAFLSLDDAKRDALEAHLKGNLQTQIPFAFLPLQDCVDLAIFLIRMTIVMQHWIIGVRGVGGAVDVAVITQTSGFTEIQKKQLRGEESWQK